MTNKKTDAKRGAPSRLSLASRLLSGAVRAPVTAAGSNEPWRQKRSGGKSKGKNRK
jgi:hypothetical protein